MSLIVTAANRLSDHRIPKVGVPASGSIVESAHYVCLGGC